MKRKRGIKAKIEQHPSFKLEAKKMIMKGCTNKEICDVLNSLVKELRSKGEIPHLPDNFEFSLTNIGHSAPVIAKEIKEIAERKKIERQKNKALAQALCSESATNEALLLAGNLIDDVLVRKAIRMDEKETDDIQSDELAEMTLSYKRQVESKRIQEALIEKAIKKRDKKLLEAAAHEATIINGTASNGVDFVKRLIEQVNATNSQ